MRKNKNEANHGSIGLVIAKNQMINSALKLDSGTTLKDYNICYETYGKLNKNKDNAILICHALTGDQHAAGYNNTDDEKPGWWDNMIGPGKPVDTNKFFVICPNNLGGCGGSTGPLSQNPATNMAYGPDFPIITVRDWVESQNQLRKKLEI